MYARTRYSTGMDVNIYLPDDIGKRAKDEGLPLSRMLRDAVTEELDRRSIMANTLENAQKIELELLDNEEQPYTGTIHGKLVAAGGREGEEHVYLTTDGRVIGYASEQGKYWELGQAVNLSLDEELSNFLRDPAAYTEACHALGIKPVIEL